MYSAVEPTGLEPLQRDKKGNEAPCGFVQPQRVDSYSDLLVSYGSEPPIHRSDCRCYH
jgi:hypothetical protein